VASPRRGVDHQVPTVASTEHQPVSPGSAVASAGRRSGVGGRLTDVEPFLEDRRGWRHRTQESHRHRHA
jgi:hypothetical protein